MQSQHFLKPKYHIHLPENVTGKKNTFYREGMIERGEGMCDAFDARFVQPVNHSKCALDKTALIREITKRGYPINSRSMQDLTSRYLQLRGN